MEKIPTIKELMKLIQEIGNYNSYKARRAYIKYSKNQTPENKRLLAKRLSLAKWKLPKVRKALKEGDVDMAILGKGQCGLCFWSSGCCDCNSRGFECGDFDFNTSESDNERMLKAIREKF